MVFNPVRFSTAALLALVISIGNSACCAEPVGYYDSAEGKTGVELRQALHEIIDDHSVPDIQTTTSPNDRKGKIRR